MTDHELIDFCLAVINSLRGRWDEASIRRTIFAHNMMLVVKARCDVTGNCCETFD